MPDTIFDLDRELDRLCDMLRNTKDEQMRAKLVEAIRDVMARLSGDGARPEPAPR
jgi:type VI protein secretion system component VasF